MVHTHLSFCTIVSTAAPNRDQQSHINNYPLAEMNREKSHVRQSIHIPIPIAGDFRGSKILPIGEKYDFHGENFRK